VINHNLQATFSRVFGHKPQLQAEAPGRVNILGEHVDYNDGIVLPAAIDRRVHILAEASRDGCTHLHASNLNDWVSFRHADLDARVDDQGEPLPGWACYPAGVIWALSKAGFEVPEIEAVYTSDIPIGVGLSSSAAVEVGFASIWNALCSWGIAPLELARLCQKAENHYVGVASGLMDQFASACGVKDHALIFDTRSLSWEAVPLPPNTSLVIADSGVRRSLTHTGYNDRRQACETALHCLQAHIPGIRALRDVQPDDFTRYARFLPEIPRRRAEHVVREIERVNFAVQALKSGDNAALGALLYTGHASLRDLYEVSTPEQDYLVEVSREIAGCYGARLTGAGFGGCTINLVEKTSAEEFSAELGRRYFLKTGRSAMVYPCQASRGALVEQLDVDN
jgi:galactokinase